jgi:hypothetical protein
VTPTVNQFSVVSVDTYYFVHLPQIYAPSKRPGVRADFEGNQPKLVLHRVSYNPRQINYLYMMLYNYVILQLMWFFLLLLF